MDRFSRRLAVALLADRHAAAHFDRRALEAFRSRAGSRPPVPWDISIRLCDSERQRGKSPVIR
jgi:hypothetical protein